MKEQIILREYKKEDTEVLENITRKTWNYDRFCSKKIAKKLAKVYLINCLAEQTYTQVALLDNIPVGIIIGKNINNHKSNLKYKIKSCLSIISLLKSKEGRNVFYMFKDIHNINKKLLENTGKKYEGEVVFFTINPKFRGKGIGKQLFNSLLNYMKNENINNFYLYTDTSCNYRFYEYQGMKKSGEKLKEFNINRKNEKINFFLYEYINLN